MEKGNRLTKALGGVLVGGMLLSGGLAWADEAKSSLTDGLLTRTAAIGQDVIIQQKVWKNGPVKTGMQKNLQSALDQLIKEGTVTPQKAEEVKAYFDKVNKERQARWEEFKKLSPEQRKALCDKKRAQKSADQSKKRIGVFKGLVANNILTQVQADALKVKMTEAELAQRKQRIAEGLKTLVQDGTITAEQSDKILKQIEKSQNDRKAFFEKTKGMNKEERRQYKKDNKEKLRNPFAQLIEDGTITKQQAKAIKKAIFGHKSTKADRPIQ